MNTQRDLAQKIELTYNCLNIKLNVLVKGWWLKGGGQVWILLV